MTEDDYINERITSLLPSSLRRVTTTALQQAEDQAAMREAVVRSFLVHGGYHDTRLHQIEDEDRTMMFDALTRLGEKDRAHLSVFANQAAKLRRDAVLQDLPMDTRAAVYGPKGPLRRQWR